MILQKFYNYLFVKRGFSDVTIDGYKKVLSKFTKENNLKPTKKQVENYIVYMRDKKYSFSHIRNTTVILENYMKFLRRPIKLGRMKRPRPIVKDILTEGEVARILAICKNSREKTIIAILAYSGIRNKEFCFLKVKDVDLNEGMIKIFSGKGNKDRIAYISKECVKIISNYLKDFPRNVEGFLITTLRRKNQYTGWDLRKRIKIIAKRAMVEKRVYPHLFRHSLCSHLANKNCSILTIQNLMGHAHLNTTQIYLRNFPQKMQAEYQYLVPNYF